MDRRIALVLVALAAALPLACGDGNGKSSNTIASEGGFPGPDDSLGPLWMSGPEKMIENLQPFQTALDTSEYFPSIAIDPAGNIIVVYARFDPVPHRVDIVASRCEAGGNWDFPMAIEHEDGHVAMSQVAVDNDGSAIATWAQHDGVRYVMRAARFTIAGRWEAPVKIETQNQAVEASGAHWGPKLAMNGAGVATVAWARADATRHSTLWANRFTPGVGWGTAGLIGGGVGDVGSEQVAMNDAGEAAVTWIQDDHPAPNEWDWSIYANRFSGGGWGAQTLVETDNGKASDPDVVIDPAGHAFVIWDQVISPWNAVRAARWAAGAPDVDAAALLENYNGGFCGGPRLVVDGGGNVFAAWTQLDVNSANGSIWGAHLPAGGTWSDPEAVRSDMNRMTSHASLACDSAGRITAAWTEAEVGGAGGGDVWSSRFTPGAGWSTPAAIESDNEGLGESYAGNVTIATTPDGLAAAAWLESYLTGSGGLAWAYRFPAP